MKFPFVSRGHFDDVVNELRAQLAEQKAQNQALLAYIGIVPVQQQAKDETPAEEVVSEVADPFHAVISRRPSQVVTMAEKMLAKTYREKYPELDEIEAQGRAQAHSG